jgi:phospho-N-acetylmuramoyl-pentapeptide-transferase
MSKALWVFFASLGAGLAIMPMLIPLLYRLKFGQSIRQEGLQSHYKKAGTPNMGGLMLYVALLIGLLVANQWTAQLAVLIMIMLGHGLLGFADDFIKSARKNPDGLSARLKLLGQFSLALLLVTFLAMQKASTQIAIPFFSFQIPFGLFYWPIAMIYMVFFSNAVNIIDGVDGLCSGQTLIVTVLLGLMARNQGQMDLVYFSIALSGALLAFLYYNHYPAKIFMGDTGSLGLGAALAVLAFYLKIEVLMLWIGMVFIVDIFSTILQVLYFKKTGGKRLFKMSPIHHHFELSGWSEWKIVLVFWTWGLFFAISGWFVYLKMGVS